jgi:hypothetical protein
VPFSSGEALSRIVDSCHEIPGKPVVSPEAGFDGEMMARGVAAMRASYPEFAPVRRLSRTSGAFTRENGSAAGVPAQHPLAKRGLLGQ